jgi:hypothetical protein
MKALAAERSARMQAMSAARDNIERKLADLQRAKHRARQDQVATELIDPKHQRRGDSMNVAGAAVALRDQISASRSACSHVRSPVPRDVRARSDSARRGRSPSRRHRSHRRTIEPLDIQPANVRQWSCHPRHPCFCVRSPCMRARNTACGARGAFSTLQVGVPDQPLLLLI